MSLTSIEILKQLGPATPASRLSEIDAAIKKWAPTYGITTNQRMAAFLAQTAEETGGFRVLREIWGPNVWQMKYEGKKALGNTQPGDGKKFMGRGIIQTTGRYNYQKVSQHLFGDNRLLTHPEILEQPEYAVRSGMFYWQSNNCNRFADAGDFIGLTRFINGSAMLNLNIRQANLALLNNLLSVSPAAFFVDFLKKKVSSGFGSLNSVFNSVRFAVLGN